MSDPNNYQQVKLLSNPIKALSCVEYFTREKQISECRVFKELLNLSEGVWTVAVDSITVVNCGGEKIDATFDIRTNLISSYVEVQGNAVATNGWLASFDVKLSQGKFKHLPASKNTFFTVTSRPADTFRLEFKLHQFLSEMFMVPITYNLRVETRLLFQRLL